MEGQIDIEGRAFAFLDLKPELAKVFFNDHVIGDRQSLARSFADFLGRKERLINPVANGLWNPATGVLNSY